METSLAELTAEIRRRVAALGFELVDIRTRGTRTRVSLQIRIDRADSRPGHGITIEQCSGVSRSLQDWLDGEQVLGPRYALEVSSPGIERPVRWREHWQRYVGHDVNVRLPGRGRVRARILAVPEHAESVVLQPAGEDAEVTVPLDQARDATLAVDWSVIDWSGGRTNQ